MKSLAAVVAVVLLVGHGNTADPPKKAPTAAETLQRLQGTWTVETWEESGKALGAADLKKRGIFFGGNIFIQRRNSEPFQASTVQLDPSKSPCTINLSVKEGE